MVKNNSGQTQQNSGSGNKKSDEKCMKLFKTIYLSSNVYSSSLSPVTNSLGVDSVSCDPLLQPTPPLPAKVCVSNVLFKRKSTSQ